MHVLDETDAAILRALLEDARRPWSGIPERVGLSPPAVSGRVDRLRDAGDVEGFSADLDRRELESGVAVLLTLEPVEDSGPLREPCERHADGAGDGTVTAEVQSGATP